LPSSPGAGSDYVVGPSDIVIRIRGVERRFLQAIDGKKNLRWLLGKYEDAGLDNLVEILVALGSQGLIVM
jgi:hypothetical protein